MGNGILGPWARRTMAVLVAVGLAVVSGGCGSGRDSWAAVPIETLVGAWTIHDTGGDDDGAVAYIAVGIATIYRSCGELDYVAVFGPGAGFRAQALGGSEACYDGDGQGWIERARSVQLTKARATFFSADGSVLARLTKGGTPVIADTIDADSVQVPKLSAEDRGRLAPERPVLLRGMSAPSSGQIVGRWRAPGTNATNAAAGITFAADGTWSGSDGCNGVTGVWLVGAEGWWMAAAGAQTQIGCDNIDVGAWAQQASQVALTTDGELIFFSEQEGELGRLAR